MRRKGIELASKHYSATNTMKRTKPLRRTPLKRCARSIRRVSKKRAKDMKTYALLREAFLKANPVCRVSLFNLGEVVPATEVHHVKGWGKHYLDVDSWMAVSRQGHEWIHNNPSKARKFGYLK
jgi:hypothetical protein